MRKGIYYTTLKSRSDRKRFSNLFIQTISLAIVLCRNNVLLLTRVAVDIMYVVRNDVVNVYTKIEKFRMQLKWRSCDNYYTYVHSIIQEITIVREKKNFDS